jgi:hypothetical protein
MAAQSMRFGDLSNQQKAGVNQVIFSYSRISRTERFLILVEAALKIVLIALAVRPCLPMTFPRSSLATFNSMTEVCSPSISLTSTWSGWSTNALAMYFTNSFMPLTSSFRVAGYP